jgi:multidrug efflux pump subunit AcrB
MWIVRLALRRPYTFVVTAMLILLLGGAMARRMPADIFPAINIPVVTVIRTYTGMSPQEMERRIVTITERAYTASVGARRRSSPTEEGSNDERRARHSCEQ